MLKTITCLSLALSSVIAIEDLEKLTYETLANSGWTDHVQAFQKLFQMQKVGSFLEFGMGLGTKFFLENCSHVTSIDLTIKKRYPNILDWHFDCLDLYRSYNNWSPALKCFSNLVNQADALAEKGIDPATSNGNYLVEINQFLDEIFSENQYDVAFVDPGFLLRGDLVNSLFGRVDIIAAHDTNFLNDVYGWSKIKTPENYEKIVFAHGSGTTFWIIKTRKFLIDQLKN